MLGVGFGAEDGGEAGAGRVTSGNRMRIESIRWLSKPTKEAEVKVSDGSFTCEAYSMPCDASVGDDLLEPLHVFEVRNAMRIETGTIGIRKSRERGLEQHVVARVKRFREGRLSVGGIELVLDDPLPGGIQDGDVVELDCARIDLW
jgi:hypothetical protein